MRRQCLFDPNHLIDEYGYDKHLEDCKSRLKKDWRKCRYEDTHWFLYSHIDFHQKFECPKNPLCVQNPDEFFKRRQLEIRKIQKASQRQQNSQMKSVLSELKEGSDEEELSFQVKSSEDKINFGEISMIEGDFKINQSTSKLSHNKTLQNHSIMDLHEALSNDPILRPIKNSSALNQSIHSAKSRNSQNTISSKDQEAFEKGIVVNKKLWQEPDFVKFEADFRKTWQSKKQGQNGRMGNNEEEKVEQSFEEDIDELQMSIHNISSKFNDIDQN